MSTSTKIPFAEAYKIAKVIHTKLNPHCEEFIFAGSLRRKCDMIGDIV